MIIKIPFSPEKKIVLKKGDRVDFNTDLFFDIKPVENTIFIAEDLKISPKKFFSSLKKFVGEKVKKNEVIAEVKGFLKTKKILSPIDGEIAEINHEKAFITIKSLGEQSKTPAYFKGQIKDISKNIISLQVNRGIEIVPKKASKIPFGAKVVYTDDFHREILDREIKNKAIFSKKFDSYMILKAEVLEVAGLISLNFPDEEPNLPFVQIKTQNDFDRLKQEKFPYCLNLPQLGKIYFYE